MSFPAADAGDSPAPKRNFAARLFGYDLFISFALGPAPRGSLSYASDLARRLRERDFSVFFSEDEAPPGERLDSTLLKALHSSRLLVVIANRGTLEQPRWVRKEVEEFRRRHPGRTIIPISVGGALEDPALAAAAQEWLVFQDKIWLDECTEAASDGIASKAVLERLAMAPTRVRANVWWRWLVRGVMAVLATLAVALGVAAKVAADSAERARDELRRAVSLRLIGEAPAMLDGARAGGDEQTLQQVLVAQRLAGPSAEADRALLSTLKAVPHLSKAVNTGLRIGDVAFSRDGTHVVSGASDGSLQVWDASTLQALGAALKSTQNDISTLSLSADGKTLVAGSSDGTLQLWDLVTRKPLGEAMKAHKNEAPPWSDFGVQTVAISPDGRRAASAGWDWTLKLWDTKAAKLEGKPLMEAEGFVNRAIAFNADGSRITAAGNELVLRLWNADTRELLATLDLRKAFQGDDDVAGLAFSPAGTDGFAIVAGTEHKGVWLWNAKTGQRRLLEGTPSGKVTRVTFSADGLRVLASTESGRVQVWNAATGKPVGALQAGADGSLTAVDFSLDGGTVVSGDQDGRLRLWDIAGRHSLLAVLKPGHEDERNLVFGTNGALLAVGNTAGKVELRSMEGGHVVRALPGAAARDANLVALSADGMRLVTTSMPAIRSPNATGKTPAREAGDEATLSSGAFMQLWNSETGYPIGEPVKAQHRRIFNGAAFRFDGARFVTYEQEGDTPGDYTQVDGRLQVWDANTGQAIGEPLTGHRGGIRHAAFDPQGTTLVSAGADGTLRLWDAERQLSLPAPAMLHEDVAVVAFSPDGRQIVSGADNGSVKVWDVNAGAKADVSASGKARPRLDVKFSETQIWAVAFSPDGARVFASGSDGVRLWNAHSGHLIGSLPRSTQHGPVFGLAFNPQGTMLGYTKAGFVIQWAQAAVWAELLCARLTRNMGRQAWKELVSPEIDYQVQCPSLPATP
jgi:WD40 repeat protein